MTGWEGFTEEELQDMLAEFMEEDEYGNYFNEGGAEEVQAELDRRWQLERKW